MSMLKKPAVAFLLSLLIVLLSTFISAKVRLERNYDQVCETLCDQVLSFAEKNELISLEAAARSTLSHQNTNSRTDYDGLILSYTELASGFPKEDTRSVDQAIKSYTHFFQGTERFPANLFVRLLNIY